MEDELSELLEVGKSASISEIRILVREVKIAFEEVETVVTVRIYRCRDTAEPYCFETSHYIKTPKQAGPWKTNWPAGATEKEALRRAIRTLAEEYESAKNAGEKPREEWFVVNDTFGR